MPWLRAVAWVYSFQPWWMRSLWGRLLGETFRVFRFREEVIQANLGYAYPGESLEARNQRARIQSQAYAHLGNLILEVLMIFGPMDRFIRKNLEVRGFEHWQEAHRQGKGVIFLASHVGNWEVMAASAPVFFGIDLLLVTKRLKPNWFHRAVESARLAYGVRATYEPKTLREILAQLKTNRTVGFVMDQYAGPPVGIRVPVFGVPVSTPTAVAALAKRTGAAVLPVVNYRTPDGQWVAEIRPALPWESNANPSRELAINTARYAAALEKDIYAHPDQWLWTHRRFKGDLGPLREGEWEERRPRT